MGEPWREVDDRIFVRRHTSYDLNVGLVVGDGACVVIDTRQSLAAGTELLAAIREVTPHPCLVVNTHAHFDHFLGNAAFGPTQVWASRRCRDVMVEFGEVQRRVMAQFTRENGKPDAADEIDASPLVVPTHTFETPRYELRVGDRSVWLHQLGRGHTDTDIVVSVSGSPVVFAGDLVEEGAPPAYDESFPLDWASTLDGVLRLASGAVVPGHGDVVDPDFVREQQELHIRVAATARDRTRTGVPGLPDDVAETALARARGQLDGTLHVPTPAEILAEFGLG